MSISRESFTPNRVIAVLTPLVFAPLAGIVATWLAQHFPGLNLGKDSLEQVFAVGALAALAPAAQWLHGWQKFEARQDALGHDLALAAISADPESLDASALEDFALDGLGDLEDATELEDLDDLEAAAELDDLDELESFNGHLTTVDR